MTGTYYDLYVDQDGMWVVSEPSNYSEFAHFVVARFRTQGEALAFIQQMCSR